MSIWKILKYMSPIVVAAIVFTILQAGSYCILSNLRGEYILSSITQGFASLLALVFVIVFFICQSTGRFSTLSQILNPIGNLLIITFIGVILFPLIALKFTESIYFNILINISISSAFLCFFLLWIFVIEINVKLRHYGIRYILPKLKRLKLPEEKEKYMELITDVKEIGPQAIFEFYSGSPTLFILDLSHLMREQDDSDILDITLQVLSDILFYAGKKGKLDEIIPLYKNNIDLLLFENLSGEKPMERFLIGINLEYKVLSLIKAHKDKYKEDMIDSAKNILFLLFSLSTEKEGKSRLNRKISFDFDFRYRTVEDHIVNTVKNNTITEEEYWEAYKEKFSSLDETEPVGFKSYLKKLFKKAKSN
jgi:hypothetical protein